MVRFAENVLGPTTASSASQGSPAKSNLSSSASQISSAPTSITWTHSDPILNFSDVATFGDVSLRNRITIPSIEKGSIPLTDNERATFARVQGVIQEHIILQGFIDLSDEATLLEFGKDLLRLAMARTNHLYEDHTALRDELTKYNVANNRSWMEDVSRETLQDRLWQYAIFAGDLKEFKVNL